MRHFVLSVFFIYVGKSLRNKGHLCFREWRCVNQVDVNVPDIRIYATALKGDSLS